MRQLWNDMPPVQRATCSASGGYVDFSVLGRRFLYQPDDMRLFQLAPDAPLPAALPVRVPQFELPAIRPQMVVLLPTLACNLRCRYCFEGPGAPAAADCACAAASVMPETVLRKALELLPTRSAGTVGFFGGEPLLAMGLVRRAVELARNRLSGCNFCLTTNGTCIDAEIARFLDENGFSLIVSLDGPAHLHNPARPLASGEGSYERVLHGLRLLAAFPRLAARTTLRGTYDGAERACLLERVRHLNELCRAYGMRNVSVEPAELAEGCTRGGQPVLPSELLYEEYMDTAVWCARERRAGRPAYFHHFDIRLARLRRRQPAPSECGAGVGYCAVTPDGVIHACHRLGSPVGRVQDGINQCAQQPWRDNRYYARTGCADCWMRNVCGGGCRVNSLHTSGDLHRPETLGCWLTETCLKGAAYLLSCENQQP